MLYNRSLFLSIPLWLPCGSDSKESACNRGDPGSVPGLGRSPREGNGNPLQYSCQENPRGRQWGHKEVDTTEQLHFHFTFHSIHTLYSLIPNSNSSLPNPAPHSTLTWVSWGQKDTKEQLKGEAWASRTVSCSAFTEQGMETDSRFLGREGCD